jgi:hypothetical protein
MQTDPFSSNGLFAMALLPHLSEKLVDRGILPASDVSEAADKALLNLEEWQGAFPDRSRDFELARAALDELVAAYRNGDRSDNK